MRNYLIPESGNFYKANLHTHSSVSDGSLTPEGLKAVYKSNGYSVLAITDHEILLNHSYLNDDSFLTITGYEISVIETKSAPFEFLKTCHINLFSSTPDNVTAVCFNPAYCWCIDKGIIDRQKYSGDIYTKEYTPDAINYIIEEANKNGFIVQYNHPSWSLETIQDFGKYNGFFAMEIYNSCSFSEGIFEYNIQAYDAYLRSGKRVFCTATDDKHSSVSIPTPGSDSFGGFTMIKAKNLTYKNIIDALKKGDFYASYGPEIYDLYLEDKKAYIKCSDAKYISMTTFGRRAKLFAADVGKVITEAVFDIIDHDGYIRFDVVDEEGKHANTRAYFLDEFYNQN